MLDFYRHHAFDVHSQNGEDGIIGECVRRMINVGSIRTYRNEGHDIPIIHCVEIGANDGHWMSNTRHLIDQGASCLFVESNYGLYLQCTNNWKHNPRVRVQCSHVNGENVNAFVDESCDVFSSDTDGSDLQIFAGLQARPKIVIVEIDSSLNPEEILFNQDGGAGYRAMLEVAIAKGYFLLCHTGNLIFVRADCREFFPEIADDPVESWESYFRTDWLKAA